MSNQSLKRARKTPNDEYYTSKADIEKELAFYRPHFEGKSILLNCGDSDWSEFWFAMQRYFHVLKIKKVVSTHFNKNGSSYKLEMTPGYFEYPEVSKKISLNGSGDFADEECRKLMQECDIVLTNPPFSLFSKFVNQIIEMGKQFLIIGSENKLTATYMAKLIKNNQVWIGMTKPNTFTLPDGSTAKLGNCCWFTNLPNERRISFLNNGFTEKEAKITYQKYINYNAIEVPNVKDIPDDYMGEMGVPIGFIYHFNPKQFELIGMANDCREKCDYLVQGKPTYVDEKHKRFRGMVLTVDGKPNSCYARWIIKRKEL